MGEDREEVARRGLTLGPAARRAAAWAPVALLLAAEYGLSSQSHLPQVVPGFVPHGDKLLHAGYFFLTAIFAIHAMRAVEGWSRGRTAIVLLLSTLAWGAFDEWHQSFVPGRSADAADAAADVAGAALALAAAELFSVAAARRQGGRVGTGPGNEPRGS